MRNAELKKMIEDLGGPPALFEILLDFYREMSRDVMIGFFFDGKDLAATSKRQGEFLLMAAGIEPAYSGKGPATAHTGLPPILPGHFDRRITILRDLLARKGLSAEHIRIWTEFEEAFRAVVVRRTHPS
jgi:truncated hemoglobin YjbI